MNPSSLLIILLTAVWVSVTTLSAATTNAAASIGPSVAGQVPVYTDTTGQLMTPSSSLTNFTFVTPVITVPGGYYSGSILTPWVDTNNLISLQWKKAPQVWEMMNSIVGDWTAFVANSGSTAADLSDGIEMGVVSLSAGSVSNGVAGIRNVQTSVWLPTNNICVTWFVRTPSSLSSDSTGYAIYSGFTDSTGDAAPVDGAYFLYTHSVSNGVWVAQSANNSATTFASGAASPGPTVVSVKWYGLRVEGNKDVVNFWISVDLGSTWQWVGFSAGNLPNSSGRQTGLGSYIRKLGGSVGTQSVSIGIGRCEFWSNSGN